MSKSSILKLLQRNLVFVVAAQCKKHVIEAKKGEYAHCPGDSEKSIISKANGCEVLLVGFYGELHISVGNTSSKEDGERAVCLYERE